MYSSLIPRPHSRLLNFTLPHSQSPFLYDIVYVIATCMLLFTSVQHRPLGMGCREEAIIYCICVSICTSYALSWLHVYNMHFLQIWLLCTCTLICVHCYSTPTIMYMYMYMSAHSISWSVDVTTSLRVPMGVFNLVLKARHLHVYISGSAFCRD